MGVADCQDSDEFADLSSEEEYNYIDQPPHSVAAELKIVRDCKDILANAILVKQYYQQMIVAVLGDNKLASENSSMDLENCDDDMSKIFKEQYDVDVSENKMMIESYLCISSGDIKQGGSFCQYMVQNRLWFFSRTDQQMGHEEKRLLVVWPGCVSSDRASAYVAERFSGGRRRLVGGLGEEFLVQDGSIGRAGLGGKSCDSSFTHNRECVIFKYLSIANKQLDSSESKDKKMLDEIRLRNGDVMEFKYYSKEKHEADNRQEADSSDKEKEKEIPKTRLGIFANVTLQKDSSNDMDYQQSHVDCSENHFPSRGEQEISYIKSKDKPSFLSYLPVLVRSTSGNGLLLPSESICLESTDGKPTDKNQKHEFPVMQQESCNVEDRESNNQDRSELKRELRALYEEINAMRAELDRLKVSFEGFRKNNIKSTLAKLNKYNSRNDSTEQCNTTQDLYRISLSKTVPTMDFKSVVDQNVESDSEDEDESSQTELKTHATDQDSISMLNLKHHINDFSERLSCDCSADLVKPLNIVTCALAADKLSSAYPETVSCANSSLMGSSTQTSYSHSQAYEKAREKESFQRDEKQIGLSEGHSISECHSKKESINVFTANVLKENVSCMEKISNTGWKSCIGNFLQELLQEFDSKFGPLDRKRDILNRETDLKFADKKLVPSENEQHNVVEYMVKEIQEVGMKDEVALAQTLRNIFDATASRNSENGSSESYLEKRTDGQFSLQSTMPENTCVGRLSNHCSPCCDEILDQGLPKHCIKFEWKTNCQGLGQGPEKGKNLGMIRKSKDMARTVKNTSVKDLSSPPTNALQNHTTVLQKRRKNKQSYYHHRRRFQNRSLNDASHSVVADICSHTCRSPCFTSNVQNAQAVRDMKRNVSRRKQQKSMQRNMPQHQSDTSWSCDSETNCFSPEAAKAKKYVCQETEMERTTRKHWKLYKSRSGRQGNCKGKYNGRKVTNRKVSKFSTNLDSWTGMEIPCLISDDHKVRRELDSGKFNGKFQVQIVSMADSGFYSSLVSVRSLIIQEQDTLKNMAYMKRRCRKRDSLRCLSKLDSKLKADLQNFSSYAIENVNRNIIVFPGLQSYFDSIRNGESPSFQECMAYEWLRLNSYSNYTGSGSPVHLARGGFFHHQSNETRCFVCDTSYSEWQYTDDVQAVHRRISPNCPFVTEGIESNGNIAIDASSRESQSSLAATNLATNSSQQSALTQSASSIERQGTNSAASHGGFAFSPAARVNQGGQSAAESTSPARSNYSFYGADVTSRLRALTIQQSAGIQQPADEPVSENPVRVPTQPSQIPRQADGDAQLTVSAQHQPEGSGRQQNAAGIQGASGSSTTRQPENADNIQLGQLKHPRYSSMAVRMSSFASWPSYLNQTPRQMAYAGFFHPGVADFARCFCCGGGLRNWEADDDPMVEHARWYPKCEYVNKLKGPHFIQAVLRRHREHMAERQREQEAVETSFTSPDPMTTDVAAGLLEMGFTRDRAREAILTVRRLRGRAAVSIEEVTAWMLDDDGESNRAGGQEDIAGTGQRSEQQREPSPPNSASGSIESSATTQGASSDSQRSTEEPQGATGGGEQQVEDKGAKDKLDSSSADESSRSKEDKSSSSKKSKSKKDKKSKTKKAHSPSASHGDIDTKSLKEENKQLKQMQVCKICMDQYVSVTFLPCGHLVCCDGCARNMRKCPICRKRIKGQVKTFMS